MRFAAVLLLVVYLVHYGTGQFAEVYPDTAAAERALFYAAQGFKGCVLYLVIAAMAPRRAWSIPLWAVCLWGFLEDFQVGACRLAAGIQNTPVLGDWQGMCEVVSQRPLYVTELVVFGSLAASAVGYGASRGKD